jgi:catechol 2,3-dioxygenase-like lactoylglutathione lyase family enzyme
MTRLAGPIRQMGFVVRDADAAMRWWAKTLGVGPFMVYRRLLFEDYRYRGEPAQGPVVTLAIAHSGPLQVEIVQQHDDIPSAYTEFLAAGREGFQHVSTWLDSAEAYDSAYARLLASGLQVVHEGRTAGSPVRFAYFSGPAGGWPQLEISEALSPATRPALERLQALAAAWDGNDPVRDAPPRG